MIVVGLTLTDISPAFRMLPNPLQYRATIIKLSLFFSPLGEKNRRKHPLGTSIAFLIRQGGQVL
jgi:hypothetical protein